MQKEKKLSGFSLLEVLIATAIVGIMAAAAVPFVLELQEVMDIRKTQDQLERISLALELYFTDIGTFPVTSSDPSNLSAGDQGLPALLYLPTIAPIPAVGAWDGPYLQEINLERLVKDAWGNNYELILQRGCPSNCITLSGSDTANLYDLSIDLTLKLISHGPDGVSQGGDDIEAEVSSGPIARRLKLDTKKRLEVLMAEVGNRTINNEGYLGTLNGMSSPGDPPCTLRNTEISSFSELGSYFTQDTWGNSFQWHDDTRQFYSVGPNRTDDTCNLSTLSTSDLGI